MIRLKKAAGSLKNINRMKDEFISNYQRFLFPYAYNIIGNVDDALDVVQESIVKFIESDASKILNPKSYLVKIVVNQAINFRNLIRHKRENYIGAWLPEPVSTENNAIHQIDRNNIVSYSLMVLMEKLSPKERAVFLLKEIFNYNHDEIAGIFDISIENSRQLLKRARLKIKNDEPGNHIHPADNLFVESFVAALNRADFSLLENLLREDVQIKTDSGGKVKAARNVIDGKENTLKFIRGIVRKFYEGSRVKVVNMNRQHAFVLIKNETIENIILFDSEENKISHIYLIRNPEKLKNISFGKEFILQNPVS